MKIKVGDRIRAFLKKSEGVPDGLVGREASPFAGREFEKVTKVDLGTGYPSDPPMIETKFSIYPVDLWSFKIMPIPSFAKTSDGREK